jgi:NhaP-type Na+/H+ or K+/H+ antiporter
MLPLAAAPGFSLGDEFSLGLVGFGIVLFAGIGALSHQHERAFSASIIYLVLGLSAGGALSLLDVAPIDEVRNAALVEHVTEVALIIAVFGAGLSIERQTTWHGWRSVAGLIGVVMPLSIAAVALFGVLVMGLSLGAAIILGAILAPTDPVLAGDVGLSPPGESLEDKARFALGTEAALNDGLAAPFVLLGIFVAGQGGTEWLFEWVAADVLYAILLGGVIGGVGGYLIGALAVRSRDAELLDQRLDFYVAIPTAILTYGGAELAGGYGFVAVFCAGVAFRHYESGHEYNRHVHDGAEVVGSFGELVVILLLGSMVTLTGLEAPGAAGWLLVPLLLLVIRPGLVMALFARSTMRARERAFVAWFGVRGVAAIYYAVVVAGTAALAPGEQETIFWTAAVCVMVSILVHGVSATHLTRHLLD